LEKRLVLGAKRWLVTLECGFQPGFCFQRWLPFCGSIPARKRDFGWGLWFRSSRKARFLVGFMVVFSALVAVWF
jgi:hypothetical protein